MPKIRNAAFTVTAVIAAIVLAASPAIAATPTAAYGAGGRVGWHHPVVRPHVFYFGAGGDFYVTDLTWNTWKTATAGGAGLVHINNCVPNCAGGTITVRAATMAFSVVRTHAGQPYFARMVLRWPNHKDVLAWSQFAAGTLFAWNVTSACHPLTNGGNCYEPGEFCRTTDHGVTGVAGDGEAIKCENSGGWRWEPS